MERVSPKAHLSVLICVFVADLAVLPLLPWQLIRLGSKFELFSQPQVRIKGTKFLLDAALVILMVLDTSKAIDNRDWFWLTVDFLLRFSVTCVTISEFLLLCEIFARAYCGRLGWWRNLGLVVIAFLTLLKLLPLLFKLRPVLSFNTDAFGFWTVFGAGLLENLVFSVVYWWAFCKDRRKWSYRRLTTPILCSAVVLAVSLIMGWRLLSIQRLLHASFLLLISIQSLLHSALVEYSFVQAQTEGSENVRDEALNESVRVLNNYLDSGKPSTSRSWKPLRHDGEDTRELYACSVSDIHAAKNRETPGEGKMAYTRRFHKDRENIVSVDIAYGKPFSPGDPRLSSCISPPPGWRPQMSDFTLDLISKGENLETEWPKLTDCVDLRWLEHIASKGIGPKRHETI